MALTRYKRYMPTLMLGALCLMYAAFLSDRATVERLTREDGPIETCGALLLLAASVLFFIAYLGSNHPNRKHDGPGERSRRNLFFLLLSAMFVLGFLEEISWGQRILNNKTPDFILTENTQGETNIHNLRWFEGGRKGAKESFWQLCLNMERLFQLFWICFCVGIPLLSKYVPMARKMFHRIRLPVLPLHYAFLFTANYLLSRMVAGIHPIYTHGAVEAKETGVEFLFMCAGVGQVCQVVTARRPTVATSAEEESGTLGIREQCPSQPGLKR